MGRLFGTDGVRGVANSELTCEMAMNIGRAAAMVLTDSNHRHPKVLIGKDTRISSDMLESAITAGLCSVGANVVQLGVVPTPAVAFLVGKYKADAGVMLTASHNPCEFNGIKIFSGDGYKLPDALEEQIEAIVLDHADVPPVPTGGDIGSVTTAPNVVRDYVDHIKSTVPFALTGMRIGIDCANGAASRTAELLFTELGAECHMLADKPNGVNVNDNCGSTHMENLMSFVKENHLDAGIAFDGDADRCLFVDEQGDVMDGDHLMVINALRMKKEGRLNANMVVGTVMSNLGFGKALAEHGCRTVATNVGDRYVLEEMKAHGYSLGGEQSGHIIFPEFNTTGDGLITAMQTLMVLRDHDGPLSELNHLMTTYPQLLKNVKVYSKNGWEENEQIRAAIAAAKDELGNDGRILVRASGTEPLIRVMGEGSDKDRLERVIDDIVSVVEQELGEE